MYKEDRKDLVKVILLIAISVECTIQIRTIQERAVVRRAAREMGDRFHKLARDIENS